MEGQNQFHKVALLPINACHACMVLPSVIYHTYTNDDDLFNAEEDEDEVHQTTDRNRFCADNDLGKA